MSGHRKTWIKVKRGIIDPKHVRAIGPAWWTYALVLDGADWTTGCYEQWRDKDAAETLGLPERTIRDHRERLEAGGYFTTERHGHFLRVMISNWTNPREYSGEVYNQRPIHPPDMAVPADGSSDTQVSLDHDQTNPIATPIDTPIDTAHEGPSLSHKITDHTPKAQEGQSLSARETWKQFLATEPMPIGPIRDFIWRTWGIRLEEPADGVELATLVVSCPSRYQPLGDSGPSWDGPAFLLDRLKKPAERRLKLLIGRSLVVQFVPE